MLLQSNDQPRLSPVPRELNDELTQLYNREGFISAGEDLLRRASASEPWACLVTLQVDHLDVISHALGSDAANRFLTRASACLREVFRRSAVIGRISSERFAVLMLVRRPSACALLFERLLESVDAQNARRQEIDLSLFGGFSRFEVRDSAPVVELLNEGERQIRMRA